MHSSRPSSRAGTPSSVAASPYQHRHTTSRAYTSDDHRQIALAENASRGQVRREVESAALRMYQLDVRGHRDEIVEGRRQRTQELEDSHRHAVGARNRSALAARVDRTRLEEDEVLQDKRLHAALEAKLGRLTYLREQARVQRVIGTTRALLRRREQEKHQRATLMELMEHVNAKEANKQDTHQQHCSTTHHNSPVRTSASSPQQQRTRPGSSAEQQRVADIQARQRMVEMLVLREDHQRGFQPRPSAGSRGMVSAIVDEAPSASRTPTPHETYPEGAYAARHRTDHHPLHQPTSSDPFGRPLSRATLPSDEVDWGGPASNQQRPMSRQSQERLYPHSRLSSAGSSSYTLPSRVGTASTIPRSVSSAASSTGSRKSMRSRYMLIEERKPKSLPPIPAPIDSPAGAQPPPLPRRSGSTRHPPDPFLEENTKGPRTMGHRGDSPPLNLRRPNSRGAEAQHAFSKHSMRVLGDIILGNPATPQRWSRSTSPHPPAHHHNGHAEARPSSCASVYRPPHEEVAAGSAGGNRQHHRGGGRREFRTVQTTSRMLYESIAGGVCPPMSNCRGQLDSFESHVSSRSIEDAGEWVRLFGRHRAQFIPWRNEARSDLDDDGSDEEDSPPAPVEPRQEPRVYEMVDMQLPNEFHERRAAGGEWVTVLPVAENDGGAAAFEDEEEGLIGRDDGSTSSHITTNEDETRSHPGEQTDDQQQQQQQQQQQHDNHDPCQRPHRCVASPTGERLGNEPTTMEARRLLAEEAPRRGDHDLGVPPQQLFDDMRARLHAHHGGAGGDSPSRSRGRPYLCEGGQCMLGTSFDESRDGEEREGGGGSTAARDLPTSLLPRHEPDFSFDNFLSGNFEVQAPVAQRGTARIPEQYGSRKSPPSLRSGRQTGEEEEAEDVFPAPPEDSSRFVDFGSSSSDEEDGYNDDPEFEVDDGAAAVTTASATSFVPLSRKSTNGKDAAGGCAAEEVEEIGVAAPLAIPQDSNGDERQDSADDDEQYSSDDNDAEAAHKRETIAAEAMDLQSVPEEQEHALTSESSGVVAVELVSSLLEDWG